MNDLYEARRRYVRMLDALGHATTTDTDLRMELNAAISAIDRKIETASRYRPCPYRAPLKATSTAERDP